MYPKNIAKGKNMVTSAVNMVPNSETKSELVTIIIPAHNAEKWIKRCVSSALSQTYEDVEVIVVENGSTDRTKDMIEAITDSRLRIYESEKGVSNARNNGIDVANGQYLAFLDADDWLEDDAIEQLMNAADPGIDIVSARYFDDKPFEKYKRRRYESGSKEYILKCLYTPTKRGNVTGNLYRTAFIRESGVRFNPDFSHAEDSVFFLGLLMKNPVVMDMEEPVYHVFINPESATRKMIDVIDFSNAIRTIYGLVEGRGSSIINGGYVFALNQLLVIFVNSQVNTKIIASACKMETFEQAIRMSDIEQVPFGRKVVFRFLKMKWYNLVFFAIRIRQVRNSIIQNKSKRQCV